jgi:hypothetical protein
MQFDLAGLRLAQFPAMTEPCPDRVGRDTSRGATPLALHYCVDTLLRIPLYAP